VRVAAKAGSHIVSVAFDRKPALPEGVMERSVDRSSFSFSADEMQQGNPAVSTVSIGGPFNASGAGETASRRRIFACRPIDGQTADETRCAKRILANLARRAYRRPVRDRDVQRLFGFFE